MAMLTVPLCYNAEKSLLQPEGRITEEYQIYVKTKILIQVMEYSNA